MVELFQVTGAVAWLVAVGTAGWLLLEIAVGFANAVSYCRFNLASMRRHGRRPRWHYLPASFFRLWVEYVGYRNRGACTVTTGSGDTWRGIGDWTLASARPAPPEACPPA